MKLKEGQYIEVYSDGIFGKILTTNDDTTDVEVLMCTDKIKEGTIIEFPTNNCTLSGNNSFTKYEDYLKWKRVNRDVYQYKVGDLIKNIISLRIFEVSNIEDDYVKCFTIGNDGVEYEAFFHDNSCYVLLAKTENIVEGYFS